MRAPRSGRAAAPALLALTFGLALTACGSDGEGGTEARTVEVALTDSGCEPANLALPAGATTFKVTNKGTEKVSELEVKSGDRIVGEVENVTAGLERSFSLELEPGTYVLECPGGGAASEGKLTVSASDSAPAGRASGLVKQRFDGVAPALASYRRGPGEG